LSTGHRFLYAHASDTSSRDIERHDEMTSALRNGLLLTIIIAGFSTVLLAQRSYTRIDLGSLAGHGAVAFGVNDRMQVVGVSSNADGISRPFLWSDGVMTSLAVLPGHFSAEASDINNRGDVVGSSGTETALVVHAVLWRNGLAIDLGTISGNFSQAFAISDNGAIVGWSSTPSGMHAALWTSGTIVDLGTLPGGGTSEASDVNNRGDIVGSAVAASGERHAFLWTGGTMFDLGTLPGDDFSEAFAINDRGQVVGRSANIGASTERAFIWEDGVMRELGIPSGGTFSRAYDLNNQSQAVGVVGNSLFRPRAAIFSDGSISQLPGPSDEEVSFAHAINNRGAIVGYSAGPAGNSAVLWLPAN
jgi:probable HAF family extracellular repeat protein